MLLSLLKDPLPEAAAKMLIVNDPLYDIFLKRGWVIWSTQEGASPPPVESALDRLLRQKQFEKSEEASKEAKDIFLPKEVCVGPDPSGVFVEKTALEKKMASFVDEEMSAEGGAAEELHQSAPASSQPQQPPETQPDQIKKRHHPAPTPSQQEIEESLRRFLAGLSG